MKKLLSSIVLSVGALVSWSNRAEAAPPACVSTLLSGMQTCGCGQQYKPVKLVIHRKDSAWVSYSTELMCKDASGNAINDIDMLQAFSDRLSGSQYFDINNRDHHRATVSAVDGHITIQNFTWGFTTTLTNTACSGNLITASNSTEFYTLSFGALKTNACP